MKPIKLVYSLWFMVERLRKQKIQILTLSFFLLLSTINYQPSTAYAAIPKLINYQGRLLDSQGRPLTDGKYKRGVGDVSQGARFQIGE